MRTLEQVCEIPGVLGEAITTIVHRVRHNISSDYIVESVDPLTDEMIVITSVIYDTDINKSIDWVGPIAIGGIPRTGLILDEKLRYRVFKKEEI